MLSRLIDKAARQTELIWKGHILNPLWHDREERRKKREGAYVTSLLKYLRRRGIYAPTDEYAHPDSRQEPERVFSIWLQGEENAPELVKACFRSMRRELPYEVVVLDEHTISDWITLPPHIMERWRSGKMLPAHFTDICRVELVYQHGGYWFDSTDYVTAPVEPVIADAPFFMYMAGDKISCNYSYVQNCFIRSRKGAPLLKLWRDAIFKYWEKEPKHMDYFVHQLIFKGLTEENPTATRLFQKMPHIVQDPTHELWFDHLYEPYDEARYRELTKGAFFQKTTYRTKGLDNVPPGTIAAHMLYQ